MLSDQTFSKNHFENNQRILFASNLQVLTKHIARHNLLQEFTFSQCRSTSFQFAFQAPGRIIFFSAIYSYRFGLACPSVQDFLNDPHLEHKLPSKFSDITSKFPIPPGKLPVVSFAVAAEINVNNDLFSFLITRPKGLFFFYIFFFSERR